MKFNNCFFLPVTAVILLTSCTSFPFAFKQDTPQGNIIEQAALEQLKTGMSKEQVGFLMGYPILKESFKNDRWDYLYLLHPGRGEPKRRLITLHFTGDELVKIEGDLKPPASAKQAESKPSAATPAEKK